MKFNWLKLLPYAIGLVIGLIGGYLYWSEIGCASGQCAITSSPVNSTIYGGVMGLLAGGLWPVKEKTTENPSDKA